MRVNRMCGMNLAAGTRRCGGGVLACLLLAAVAAAGESATGAASGAQSGVAAEPATGASPPPLAAARGPSLALATEAATVALKACSQRGYSVSVTVVDSAGVQKVLLAADGALPQAVNVGLARAVTANSFRMSTAELGERIKTDATLAAQVAAVSNAATGPGGIPIRIGSEVIGAIGVGGARGSDAGADCAQAGLRRIQERLR